MKTKTLEINILSNLTDKKQFKEDIANAVVGFLDKYGDNNVTVEMYKMDDDTYKVFLENERTN